MRVRIQDLFHRNSTGVWIMDNRQDGTYIAKPIHLEFEKHSEGWHLPDPTLDLPRPHGMDLLRALMDELAANDFIRRKVDKRDGEITALKEHLSDMRKMAFNFAEKL